MTNLKTLVCLGDSQTDTDAGYTVPAFEMWPAKLQESLVASGYTVRARSFGLSGDTSAQALTRVADCFIYDVRDKRVPSVGVIYVGVNDPGASITTSQTQANIQAIIKSFKHRAIGDGLSSGPSVAGQANLPATGRPGQRYVVLSDTDTSGGIPAFDPQHHTTITGTVAADVNGQKQSVWEYRFSVAGPLGWGRVALNTTAPLVDNTTGLPLGMKYIAVLSTNYLNFTTGGDTPVTPYATYASVRTAQQAAAAAETGNGATVSYVDLYTLQKTLIIGGTVNGVTYAAGTVPDFSSVGYDATKSWHWYQNNQHHNTFGHGLVAQAVNPTVLAALGAGA